MKKIFLIFSAFALVALPAVGNDYQTCVNHHLKSEKKLSSGYVRKQDKEFPIKNYCFGPGLIFEYCISRASYESMWTDAEDKARARKMPQHESCNQNTPIRFYALICESRTDDRLINFRLSTSTIGGCMPLGCKIGGKEILVGFECDYMWPGIESGWKDNKDYMTSSSPVAVATTPVTAPAATAQKPATAATATTTTAPKPVVALNVGVSETECKKIMDGQIARADEDFNVFKQSENPSMDEFNDKILTPLSNPSNKGDSCRNFEKIRDGYESAYSAMFAKGDALFSGKSENTASVSAESEKNLKAFWESVKRAGEKFKNKTSNSAKKS